MVDGVATDTTLQLEPATRTSERHTQRVNREGVRLLDLLQRNVRYERCIGVELFTDDGKRILDFLSGYCVHAAAHNHPDVVRALQSELERCRPAMIQTHLADLAGELTEKLCGRVGGRLEKAFFASSAREGVEAAIKLARAHYQLSAEPALALQFPFQRLDRRTEPLLAALMVEPIQSEAGVCVPPADYLRWAESLCRRHGTLFVLDEVQTGMYRTGHFLAAHQFGVAPDMVIPEKAMSGGRVPCGAVLMPDEVCHSMHSSLPRALVHTSTFSENSLAMRAALATLEVLESEQLGSRSIKACKYLQARLTDTPRDFEMVKEVRAGRDCGWGLNSRLRGSFACAFRIRHLRQCIRPCSDKSWRCGGFAIPDS